MAKRSIKFGIREKIMSSLVVFVILSLCSLIIISIWSFDNIGELGSDISSDSLESQAENHLKKETKDIALNIDTKLTHVQNSVEMLASTATNIWENPDAFPNRTSYYHDSSVAPAPPDVFDGASIGYDQNISLKYSCYKLALDIYVSGYLDTNSIINESINRSAKLDFMFRELKGQNDELLWLYMGMETGVHRSYPWHGPYSVDYDPRARGWYTSAKQESSKIIWGEPYIDASGGGLVLSCSKAVFAHGKFIGVVAVDLKINEINDTILDFNLWESGYAFLIDSSSTTIAHKDLTTVGTPVTELEDDSAQFNDVLKNMKAGKVGIEKIESGSEGRFIAYAPINSTGYILGIAVPVSEVLEHARELEDDVEERSSGITTTFIIIGVIAIIITGIVAYFLGNTVVKPIKRLTDIASKLGTGEMKIDDVEEDLARVASDGAVGPGKKGDEIGQLTQTFGDMLKTLKEDIGKKEESQQVYNITIKDSVIQRSQIGKDIAVSHGIDEGTFRETVGELDERSEARAKMLRKGQLELKGLTEEMRRDMKRHFNELKKEIPYPSNIHKKRGTLSMEYRCASDGELIGTIEDKRWKRWLRMGIAGAMIGVGVASASAEIGIDGLKELYRNFSGSSWEDIPKEELFLTAEEKDEMVTKLRESGILTKMHYCAECGKWVCGKCYDLDSKMCKEHR